MRRIQVIIGAAAALAVGFGAGRLTAPHKGRLRPSEELAARALLPPPVLAFPDPATAGHLAFGATFRRQPAELLPIDGKAAVVAAFAEGAARDDPGLVRVVYLAPTRRGWVPAPDQSASVASGSFGNAGAITLRRDLGPNPVVEVRGGVPSPGCTAQQLALIELAPERAHLLIQGLPVPPAGPGRAGGVVRRDGHLWADYRAAGGGLVELRPSGDQLKPAAKPPSGC